MTLWFENTISVVAPRIVRSEYVNTSQLFFQDFHFSSTTAQESDRWGKTKKYKQIQINIFFVSFSNFRFIILEIIVFVCSIFEMER